MAKEETYHGYDWMAGTHTVETRDTNSGDSYRGTGWSHSQARSEADRSARDSERSGGLISSWF